MTETELDQIRARRAKMRFKPMKSGKVECTLCWRQGWPGDDDTLNPWQQTCMKEHTYACDKKYCTRRFPSPSAKAAHMRGHA